MLEWEKCAQKLRQVSWTWRFWGGKLYLTIWVLIGFGDLRGKSDLAICGGGVNWIW